jgi:uncharacterized radical SAM superfamily Fe-S cluster-containing enzyme
MLRGAAQLKTLLNGSCTASLALCQHTHSDSTTCVLVTSVTNICNLEGTI